MNPSDLTLRVVDWATAAPLALPLREEVFVREQGVPAELERDALDPVCRHALAETADGAVVGTGRLLPDGRIGRMAVAAPWRNRGVGARLLAALVHDAAARGFTEVSLHAQVAAMRFYARHGFVPEGEVFMEAGIAHRTMRRGLR